MGTRLPTNVKYWNSPSDLPIPRKIGKYLLNDTIGDGGFSVVKRAMDLETGQEYACKIVPKRRIDSEELKAKLDSEIELLSKMCHPSILHIYDVYEDSINYYLIMDLCNCTDLMSLIQALKRLSEPQARQIFRHLCIAIQYLHSNNVCHRDLKPENIMVFQDNSIKLIDFGFAEKTTELLTMRCGTTNYASPELLMKEPYDGKANDMFSLGVILYMMVVGSFPWTAVKPEAVAIQIIRCQYTIPPFVSPKLASIITHLLCPDPSERLTIDEVLLSDWFIDKIPFTHTFSETNIIMSERRSVKPTRITSVVSSRNEAKMIVRKAKEAIKRRRLVAPTLPKEVQF